MGEVGGAAADHADPGALLGAGLHRLDPRLVDRHREPAAPLGEDLGELARRGERPGEDALGEAGRSARVTPSAASRPPRSAARRRRTARPGGRVAGVVGGCARPGSRGGRRAAGDAAAAHVGGRLVGVAGDAVEQDAVRLRGISPRPVPAARSRRIERMSKNISEASAKRSVTATAAGRRGAARRPRPARWRCGPARPAPRRPGRRPRAGPRRPRPSDRGRQLAASTEPSASRIAAPRRSGDISVRKASAASAASPGTTSVAASSAISVKIPAVSLARASWITVVASARSPRCSSRSAATPATRSPSPSARRRGQPARAVNRRRRVGSAIASLPRTRPRRL